MTTHLAQVIVLTGGGSGGHIIPILSLAPALKKLSPNCKLIYIGLKGEKIVGLEDKLKFFDERYQVAAGKFRRYHGRIWVIRLLDLKTFLLNLRDFFKVGIGIFQARKILKKVNPDIVFSKGGFVAVPVGIAAHRLGIPIVTHDSDTTPGLANRIIGRWAKLHATGMPTEYYDYPKITMRYTGIPLSEDIKPVTPAVQEKFKSRLGLGNNQKVLLVGGAGLGSKNLNELILAIAPKLLSSNPGLHIFHFSGTKHQQAVTSNYQRQLSSGALSRVKVIGFSDKFYQYSSAADLIITRAGATSLAEFAAMHKACLVIPAPWLPSGHQLKNIQSLAKQGVIEVADDNVTVDDFFEQVNALLGDENKITQLGAAFGSTARLDAAESLAAIILDTAKK